MWDAKFESLLRSRLPGLPAQAPLTPGAQLPALGLDSVAMAALIGLLEDQYAVTIPDSALVPLTFRTPEALWSTLAEVRSSPGAAR